MADKKTYPVVEPKAAPVKKDPAQEVEDRVSKARAAFDEAAREVEAAATARQQFYNARR